MTIIAYTNHGATAIHIGGKLIRPGDTREVDASLVPNPAPAADEAPAAPPDPLVELLRRPAPEVVAGLENLADPDLVRLESIESDASRPRKSVLEAIDKLQLTRAGAALDG